MKEKLLRSFLLVLISLPFHQGVSSEHHPDAISYGEFIVRKAWVYIHRDIDELRRDYSLIHESSKDPSAQFKAKVALINALFEASIKMSQQDGFELLQFRPGGDPVFKLSPNEPPRTAVTGTSADAPIIFNLERINQLDHFNYSKALGLLIHELGHKVDKPSQFFLDVIASEIEQRSHNRESRYLVNGVPNAQVVVIHHDPLNLEVSPDFPYLTTTVAVFYPNKMISLQDALFGTVPWGGDFNGKKDYYAQVNVRIHDIHAVKIDKDLLQLTIDFTSSSYESKSKEQGFVMVGPARKRKQFVVRLTENKVVVEASKYLEFAMSVPPHSMAYDFQFDFDQVDQGVITVKAQIAGMRGEAYLFTADRIEILVDGLPETIDFDYQYSNPNAPSNRSFFSAFSRQLRIPSEFAGRSIEIKGMAIQAYLPHPPREQMPYSLNYILPVKQKIEFVVPSQGPLRCRDILTDM